MTFRFAVGLAVVATACSKDAPPTVVSPAHAGEPTASAQPAAVVASTASAATSAAPAAPAAAPPAPAGPPKDANVIVLSIDSLRADMPWAGYARPIAPRLTEFESKAVSYTDAYSVSSYTSMSLGGFLGGRIPSELVRSGYFFGTYKSNLFFPKVLQQAGVHTMGVMAHMYFKSAGFDQGFDDWKIVPGITFDPNTDRDVTSEQSESISEQLLGDAANESRRFFFWAHFLDPHDQYIRHEGIDWGKGNRDRYDGEVTFTDRAVGKLLDFIASKSWAGRTILIVTSDHGEEFGEHNMSRHGFEVWNTLVHVPLMIQAPGAKARHIDVPRSDVDLAPTILELYGLPAEPTFEGTSIVKEIYGADAAPRDVVVDLPATSDNAKRRALIHGSEKIICFDGDAYCKLFDLDKDPLEKDPTTRGDAFKEMKDRFLAREKDIKEVQPYACTGDCINSSLRRMQQGK
ncbi:MAG TPA: sulfatase [Polyangiaceae bacterium]